MGIQMLNQVFRVSIEGSLPVQGQWVNVVHFKQIAALSGVLFDDMADLGLAIETFLLSFWQDVMADSCSIDRVVIRTLTDPPQGVQRAVTLTGNNTGVALPPQVAALILLNADFLGRSFQGRLYTPPNAVSAWANTGWVGTAYGLLGDLAQALVDFPTATDEAWQTVVWSEKLAAANPVTSKFVIRDARTQRRRTVGRGS